MRDFFEGIQSFFEDFAFAPYDFFRNLELDTWWGANIINFIFMIIAFVAFLYWMKQLKAFNDSGEEDRDPTSHSYLG